MRPSSATKWQTAHVERPRPRGPLRDWILSPPQWAELGSTANWTFHRQPLRRGYYIKMTFRWGESAPCLHPDVLLNLSEVLGGEYGGRSRSSLRHVHTISVCFTSFHFFSFLPGSKVLRRHTEEVVAHAPGLRLLETGDLYAYPPIILAGCQAKVCVSGPCETVWLQFPQTSAHNSLKSQRRKENRRDTLYYFF